MPPGRLNLTIRQKIRDEVDSPTSPWKQAVQKLGTHLGLPVNLQAIDWEALSAIIADSFAQSGVFVSFVAAWLRVLVTSVDAQLGDAAWKAALLEGCRKNGELILGVIVAHEGSERKLGLRWKKELGIIGLVVSGEVDPDFPQDEFYFVTQLRGFFPAEQAPVTLPSQTTATAASSSQPTSSSSATQPAHSTTSTSPLPSLSALPTLETLANTSSLPSTLTLQIHDQWRFDITSTHEPTLVLLADWLQAHNRLDRRNAVSHYDPYVEVEKHRGVWGVAGGAVGVVRVGCVDNSNSAGDVQVSALPVLGLLRGVLGFKVCYTDGRMWVMERGG